MVIVTFLVKMTIDGFDEVNFENSKYFENIVYMKIVPHIDFEILFVCRVIMELLLISFGQF